MQIIQSMEDTNYTPDYSVFRDEAITGLTDEFEWDEFPDLVMDLLRKTVLLPRGDVQVPLVASYLSLPSGLATKVPLLFCHGVSGCGKSVIATLASKIHDTKKLGAASTMAGLRNHIQAAKYDDGRERNCCLVWDDINPSMLLANNQVILSLLKNGVERGATLTIAGGDVGENIEFDVFSPKITSSVHPIFAMYECRELPRRTLVIQHKPYQDWVLSDYSEFYKDRNPDNLVDIDDVDFSGIHQEFCSFWGTPKLMEYARIKKLLGAKKNRPCATPLWNMSKDLMTTGIVCGYWNSIEEAMTAIGDYWAWSKENIESQSSNLQKVLKRFIDDKVAELEARNDIARKCGQLALVREPELNPAELQTYFRKAISDGEVEPGTQTRQVNEAMLNLGWKLSQNQAGKSAWMKVTN